jgi:hypothetical protein
MTDAGFIHLASGDSAAGAVKMALRNLRRRERIIPMLDTLSDGPLRDVDRGGRSRSAWWTEVDGWLSKVDARAFDDRHVWSALRSVREAVVVWHGPHPAERLLLVRACWQLRDTPERVFEVKLPRTRRPGEPAFYGKVGASEPKRLVQAWSTRRRVRDVARQADRWVGIRSVPGKWIRHLAGERIVQRPLDTYDRAIVKAVGRDWTASLRVLGRVMADAPSGDGVIRWRIGKLVAAGRLEGRGPVIAWVKLPTELRVVG